MKSGTAILAIVAGSFAASLAAPVDDPACSALWQEVPKLLPNLTVFAAEAYPDNTSFTDPFGFDVGYNYTAGLSAFCRFAATVETSPTSHMFFELWMPIQQKSRWNGKFAMVGNGGVTGTPFYHYMSSPLSKYNFAVASTNTGHWAVPNNGSFALNDPEAQLDYGYRSYHLTATYSKKIIKAYYGKKAKYNYWLGCSTGGRQGMREIQQYPDDFDGALLGAPAQYYTQLRGQLLHSSNFNKLNTPDTFSKASLNALAEDVVRQCDEIDGVKDGVIVDPTKCKVDTSKFICGQTANDTSLNATTCLTPSQAKIVDQIYANWTKPDGELISPSWEPGSEIRWATSTLPIPANGIAPSYFLYQVQNVTELVLPLLSPVLNVTDLDLQDLVNEATRIDPGKYIAIDPPTEFFKKGGKFIQYHGWADQSIPPRMTLMYRDLITKALGKSVVDKGSRFFMVAGMTHCDGGPGAFNFGQSYQVLDDRNGTAQSFKFDKKHDAVLALMDWVEGGKAPEELIAAKYVEDDRRKGVAFTRPICAYPLQQHYKGKGDVTKAANWICK